MKKSFLLIITFLVFVPLQSIFAFNENISFSNYTITSKLDTINKEIDLRVMYKITQKPFYSYATIISINGKKYQQNLKYDAISSQLYTDISTRYTTIPTNLDYTISVIDQNSISKYSATGVLNIKTGTTTQNPIQVTPTTQNPTPISSNQQSANSAAALIISTIRSQYSSDGLQVSALLKEIVQLQERRLQYPSNVTVFNLVIIQLENEIRNIYGLNPTTNLPNSPTTNTYTPKYKKPSEEPARINGIGNSKSYDSWRVSN